MSGVKVLPATRLLGVAREGRVIIIASVGVAACKRTVVGLKMTFVFSSLRLTADSPRQ